MQRALWSALLCVLLLPGTARRQQPVTLGYYRSPALRGGTIVFTAEGDLWTVPLQGGLARRLTSHPGEESHAAISPDGSTIAFSANYEGPTELYTMPSGGGLPTRRTWEGAPALAVGWTPDGRILYTTPGSSTLPAWQLATLDPRTNRRDVLPLAEASDGAFDSTGRTLYFTRYAFQGSHTKRYQGGTAQSIWKYARGAAEAVPLTADYAGTSRTPMWWRNRIYFASDRDGTINLWSMDADGHDLKQLTHHRGWDVLTPALADGSIVYQLGADLHRYDIAAATDTTLEIRLASDFDQRRVRWVTNPMDYLTTAHLAPDGARVVLTARGQVFVAPAGQAGGRFVDVTRGSGAQVRYRQARFASDGKTIFALSDKSGETEWWRLPANGVGEPEQLTRDAHVLRWDGVPSPDGQWLAFYDKNQVLWLYRSDKRTAVAIDSTPDGDFADLVWSPDSKYLAYVRPAVTFSRIWLYGVLDARRTAVTTERADSYSPAFTPDGKWLYFLSDRTFQSLVGAPWGPRQPEPFFDRQTKIYGLALLPGLRSPFQPADELQAAATDTAKQPPAALVLDGIAQRLVEVPIPAGNYEALSANGTRLFWLTRQTTIERPAALQALDMGNSDITPKTLVDDVKSYELSADGKKVLLRKGNALDVIEASSGPSANLDKAAVNLTGWTFPLDPREEWRQMFDEAWRLERDYFYDPHMHGLDWPAARAKYRPLVERIADRDELSDLLAQMVSELSALHIFVYGGDQREGKDQVQTASLGAELTRDSGGGGWRVSHIYRGDPDYPTALSPLAQPAAGVHEGDVIQQINGMATASVSSPAALLEGAAGRQVLLHVAPAGGGAARDVIVTPISTQQARSLRYDDWEVSRRGIVDSGSGGQIGYVHLRSMTSSDIARWARDFYPVFDRAGLIVDVRHNTGGNIDSWVLEKLLRKAWFYWQPRVGSPYWNMQWAFRGHVVVLCDAWTASDGEAFTEGFRRLGLGRVIGTRTWGGEIWLSSSNFLVDKGIATAAEFGVYGPEGRWLIEGHGVDPDTVVDNLPHATYTGSDAQLQAALSYLEREIRAHPLPVPAAPAYPKKGAP
ncbi:MAG TPA: S41 family peptidase [Gemmatimonadales bacterium]|nr:S41 family peptidase [Gemmatimonadales bacterium]